MLFYSKCPICGWLSDDYRLDNPSIPCPHCKKPANLNNLDECREVFPRIIQDLLLQDIEHFYQRMKENAQLRFEALITEIKSKYGLNVNEQMVRDLYNDIKRIYKKKSTSDEDTYWAAINEIRKRFSGIGLGAAEGIWVKVMGLFEKEPERNVIVILTCTLVESFLFDLITKILESKGVTYELAYKITEGFHRRVDFFKQITDETLAQSLKTISEEKFWEDWDTIQKKRNKFIHKGQPNFITTDDAEKSYTLAHNSVKVFALLHNRFCVKSE